MPNIPDCPIYLKKDGNWWFPKMPSSYESTTITLINEARNTSGILRPEVIRDEVVRVDVGFNVIWDNQWSDILKCFAKRYGGSYVADVMYYDQISLTMETKQMYIGDRKSNLYSTAVINNGHKFYVGSKIAFIEV